MGFLSAQEILAADDLTRETVDVPEWGGQVLVRAATAAERDRFEFRMALAGKKAQETDVRAVLVAACLINEEGERLFTDRQVAQLSAKNSAALDRLFDVIRRLSGMTSDAGEAAVEDFAETREGGSSTD